MSDDPYQEPSGESYLRELLSDFEPPAGDRGPSDAFDSRCSSGSLVSEESSWAPPSENAWMTGGGDSIVLEPPPGGPSADVLFARADAYVNTGSSNHTIAVDKLYEDIGDHWNRFFCRPPSQLESRLLAEVFEETVIDSVRSSVPEHDSRRYLSLNHPHDSVLDRKLVEYLVDAVLADDDAEVDTFCSLAAGRMTTLGLRDDCYAPMSHNPYDVFSVLSRLVSAEVFSSCVEYSAIVVAEAEATLRADRAFSLMNVRLPFGAKELLGRALLHAEGNPRAEELHDMLGSQSLERDTHPDVAKKNEHHGFYARAVHNVALALQARTTRDRRMLERKASAFLLGSIASFDPMTLTKKGTFVKNYSICAARARARFTAKNIPVIVRAGKAILCGIPLTRKRVNSPARMKNPCMVRRPPRLTYRTQHR